MTVRCNRCGQEWPRDPALEVPCPTCRAAAGQKCRRPSGHACGIHVERDQAALETGLLAPCPVAGPPLSAHEADREFTLGL